MRQCQLPLPSDEGVHDLSRLERSETHSGDRLACFKNTFQEISSVFQATVATATTSFLMGGEIAWIGASTSLVAGAFQLALGQLADLL
ncbi:hypothetical protein F4818DRAFT_440357 [Hypoxylon cercidicola]|nr:hypothetical protein F4818DRAFT_440357 [Hypoxylon cercidicola]